MSEHTQGHWDVKLRAGVRMIAADGDVPIAEVNPFNANDEANARLLSAAPDLLAAIKRILWSHDLTCAGPDCSIAGIDAARAAVEKATGP